jgi:hypothetical protein
MRSPGRGFFAGLKVQSGRLARVGTDIRRWLLIILAAVFASAFRVSYKLTVAAIARQRGQPVLNGEE